MAGPSPAVAHTRVAVREALTALSLPPDSLILAAVSGGADSLALAAALSFEAPRMTLRAGAVIVDHGLQAHSHEVADRAAAQCRELGLAPVEVRTVQVNLEGEGPEAAARRARYAALETSRVAQRAVHVATAHTRDDQAEQVLLGLLRGSGARSLSGMSPVSATLVRPFLDITREHTEAACEALGVQPWQDPHNEDETFARVRARRLLADLTGRLGGDLRANLARTSRRARDDEEALAHWAESTLAGCAGTASEGIAVADLVDLPRAVRTRALRRLALEAGADASALNFGQLTELDRLITDWRGQGPIDLPGGLQAQRVRGALAFGPRRPVE
ncbi:tRNA lysidine(34) synthetase TilS [Demetria terragena]|uniref:tRNA lysidine(34) synthetase TilS n=1 Tax=Demetria terragena TaxID=63959 RepID=UPI00037BDD00|nr:tRNA lysidine(34) synthetase TilS [Demetria terragena]